MADELDLSDGLDLVTIFESSEVDSQMEAQIIRNCIIRITSP